MRRAPAKKKKAQGLDVKMISVRRHPKRTVFVIQYGDGRRTETPYVEIQGCATLYIDVHSKEPTIRTEANVNLGQNVGSCAICGGDTDDQHAHA